MNGIFHLPEQQISPDYKPAIEHRQRDIELQKEDMLMKLFGNCTLLKDCVYGERRNSFDFAEENFFWMELAGLLTCPESELSKFQAQLQNRFKRPLEDEAEQMAVSYLDALVKERFEE